MTKDDEIKILKMENDSLRKFKAENSQISCAYCGQLCAREVEELIKHCESCEKLLDILREIDSDIYSLRDSVGGVNFGDLRKKIDDLEESFVELQSDD